MAPGLLELQNDKTNETDIQKYYAKTKIFITGGTGFLGKILIEKLLRSCTQINCIYILIRDKKGIPMHERIDKLLDDVIFSRLKDEQPKFRHKVHGIKGDCELPNLGMNIEDIQLIQKEVNVIFHVAATVRFDEHIRKAVNINIKSTKDIIKLSRNIENLKSFVHVSTAYSNCIHDMIEEKFYEPTTIEPENLINIVDNMNDDLLTEITPRLIGKYPNTYAFTKAIAEVIVQRECENLPIAMFRPAIVISTYKEPIKGWIDNMYGPTGVTAAASNGLLRVLNCDKTKNANLIPVDMCVNALIAIGWRTYEHNKNLHGVNNKKTNVHIYNYESSVDSPLDWGSYMDYTYGLGREYPSKNVLWIFCLYLIKNNYLYELLKFLLHTIPAILFDIVLFCTGKEPKIGTIYKKIHKFCKVISYFSLRSWKFKSDNVHNLLEDMSDDDKRIFFCDLRQLDWQDYFIEYFKGIRIYLIKDPEDTLKAARVKYQRLTWIHYAFKMIVILIVLKLCWSLYNLF